MATKKRAPQPMDPSRGRGTMPPGGTGGKPSIPRQGRPAPAPSLPTRKPGRPVSPPRRPKM